MKVLLINPEWVRKDKNIWKYVASCMPPLGLAYIASSLEKDKHTVKIIDAAASKLSIKDIENKLKRFKPGMVGITATTSIVDKALYVAEISKKVLPKAKVIIGGVHATIEQEGLLANKNVDVVVRGEGEITMSELANKTPLNKINGISYRKGKTVIHNDNRELVKDLDSLPFPAYHLLPIDKYHPPLGNYKRLPAISIIATRGCPGKCTFCFRGIFGKRIRFRSPRNLVDEIKMLQKKYGIREISFYDDTFTVFKSKVKEFCTLLLSENVDITWSCMSRIDYLDLEVLSLMKKAGCHQICVGVESGDEKILANINKEISLDNVQIAIKLIQKVGIDARATFMFGNPGETVASMKKTIDFAIKLNPDVALFNITTPYPGTDMFYWAKKNGYLKTENWEDYDQSHPVMELPTVSSDEVEHYYKIAFRKFYFRPKYLLKRVMKLRSLDEIKMNLKSFRVILDTLSW
ncbi:MAG: B12-binding domain-containing radical SAM protein [DPANN group archaeon]|nr:B12-binding domain-containing radical SAM protein [DPANN group archaeon]